MPLLETPNELAATVADWLGYYGAHRDDGACPKDCRPCFEVDLADRIREAAKNELLLLDSATAATTPEVEPRTDERTHADER